MLSSYLLRTFFCPLLNFWIPSTASSTAAATMIHVTVFQIFLTVIFIFLPVSSAFFYLLSYVLRNVRILWSVRLPDRILADTFFGNAVSFLFKPCILAEPAAAFLRQQTPAFEEICAAAIP